MRHKCPKRAGGFTIVELLIAVSVFLVILFGIYNMFESNRDTYVTGTRKADVQQNARVAMDTISRQLRMAGYYPELYDNDPASVTTTSIPAPPTPAAVQFASQNALAVYGDLDGTCANPGQAACPANSSNIFLYCLSGSTIVRKKTTPSDANRFTCTGGDVLAENITSLQFIYYDGNNGIIPNPLPASGTYTLDATQLPNVRTIVITLGTTESVALPGREAQSITLTSSVRLRNL